MTTVRPADFGGYGKQTGLAEMKGGLRDKEFRSYCPPDVQPSSRIIAVCGINDFGDAASPAKDGWFISDFYLFHHLFRGLGANQIWLTCLSPGGLVEKYREYAHGNRLGERRIVLDRMMLSGVLSTGNIRVVSADILCERFLATVQSECSIAEKLHQPVLLLIFGHGEENTHGVVLGCRRDGVIITESLLHINSIKRVIGQKAEVAALLTSCFSGGWVVRPDLNTTVMAAAGPGVESESWPKSESSGRATGSIYASAVLQSLVKLEMNAGNNERDLDTSSLTYAELSKVIYRTLLDDVDRLGETHEIGFSAKDDLWEVEWRTRSGIPLTTYKERWETLRCIPLDKADFTTNRGFNSLTPSTAAQMSQGLHGGNTLRGLHRMVEAQAREYLRSYPGSDSYGGNSIHTDFRDLLKGKPFDMTWLEHLSDILIYRLSLMRFATDFKDFLKLQFPDCETYDVDAWKHRYYYEKRQQNEVGQIANEKIKRFEETTRLITREHRIFGTSLLGEQGLSYIKPRVYLAIALVESEMPLTQVEVGLDKCQACRSCISFLALKATD
ncbi:MAG: hypothetical protein M1813_005429 [Trichoglossum hirsutum]|nr:MAG: hypothetical protein M1813_005429 [Trichoglossum hirsutum]